MKNKVLPVYILVVRFQNQFSYIYGNHHRVRYLRRRLCIYITKVYAAEITLGVMHKAEKFITKTLTPISLDSLQQQASFQNIS